MPLIKGDIFGLPMKESSLDFPRVALDFMNRDHEEFVVLRATILEKMAVEPVEQDINSLLDSLYQHTCQHFAKEERVMLDAGFPAYHCHKAEHDRVISDMSAQIDHWHQHKSCQQLSAWINEAVGEWFIHHVRTMDNVTASFVSRNSIQSV